jgi:Transglycosylase-like domain
MPDQGGGISGKTLGVAFAGGVLLWSGIKGKAFSSALRDIIAGKNPVAAGNTSITDPGTVSTAQTVNQAATTGPGIGTPDAANEAIVRSVAATYGWATGQEWTDLNNIIMAESGYSNIAQNPGSTAYGIFQFLDTTWAGVGGVKTSNALLQATYGLEYIKQRYGDPIKAWAFHLANGYY